MLIGKLYKTGYNLLWSPYAGLSNPFISNPTATPWASTVYKLTKTDIASSCSSVDSVAVLIPIPVQVNIVGDTVLCFGDSIHLRANGPDSILWRYNQSGKRFDYVLHITQYIQARAIDTNNCVSWDSVLAIVNPLPLPNLGPDTSIFDNDSVVLYPGNFNSYSWNNGSNASSLTVRAASLSPGNYTYSVSVENQFACVNADTVVISITTGINHADLALGNIRIFPNPTKGKLFLKWAKDELKLRVLEVYNTSGQKIISKAIPNNQANAFVNLSTLPKGLYYIKIVADSGEKTFKIVVD